MKRKHAEGEPDARNIVALNSGSVWEALKTACRSRRFQGNWVPEHKHQAILAAQVRALEAENKRLKAQCAQLVDIVEFLTICLKGE